MKSINAALQAHLAQRSTTLAICWRVVRGDGQLILGTEHDQNIVIAAGSPDDLGGEYRARTGITGSSVRSTSDMSVDNLEVRGQIDDSLQLLDLSAADIEAGLFDDAEATLFVVNWQSPDDGQLILRHGHIGNISRTAEGEYSAELRGLMQKLSQNIVRTYKVACDADLGDTRCGVDLADWTVTGSVTGVTSRRIFSISITSTSPAEALDLEVFEPFPKTVQAGDTFSLIPGCDKRYETCAVRYDNLINFRGYGIFTPTLRSQLSGPHEGQGEQNLVDLYRQYYFNRLEEENANLIPQPSGSPAVAAMYVGGLLTFTSGDNSGYSREIKQYGIGSP